VALIGFQIELYCGNMRVLALLVMLLLSSFGNGQTLFPTRNPTKIPTGRPTKSPTMYPSSRPTTSRPSRNPTVFPTARPTKSPTLFPTKKPSTERPSRSPSQFPTSRPTKALTLFPTRQPTTSRPTTSYPTKYVFTPATDAIPMIECGDYLTENSCVHESCKWSSDACVEVLCLTKVLWNFTGDTSVAGDSTIHDFRFQHDEICSALPFASYDYPVHALTGTPPPTNFDFTGSSQDRLDIAAELSSIPFTVDVDKLTDEQIGSLCLTVEDCQVPPLLTVVRNDADGSIWKPSKRQVKNSAYPSTYCCDTNINTKSTAHDANFYTLSNMPPAAYRVATTKAPIKLLFQEFFPRGSSAQNATITKVTFAYARQRLYFYVDMTCGTARDMYRRKGFTGQWNSRLNGFYAEVIFRSRKYGDAHSVVRLDKGFISTKAEFGDIKPHSIGGFTIKMGGVGSNVGGANERYEWLSIRNYWFSIGRLDANDIVVSLMKSGFEWMFFAAPKGNWPVTLCYFLAAQSAFADNFEPDHQLDFSVVRDYAGAYYTKIKPALDYLAEIVDGKPRFMHEVLKGSECIKKLPSSYLSPFLNSRRPPEIQCTSAAKNGAYLNCRKWCSASCESFFDMILTARQLVWDQLMQEVPRCSQCPGLIGVFRDSIPKDQADHPLYSIGLQPQCLPVITPDGNVFNYIHAGPAMYKPDFSTCQTCKSEDNCVPTD